MRRAPGESHSSRAPTTATATPRTARTGSRAHSAPYDEAIVGLVRGNGLGELVDWDPEVAVAALADSFWQLLMLHGAIGDTWHAELLSYEAPTYFGMLTASFSRQD